MYTHIKPLITALAQQNRVTVMVLGEHIKRSAQADVFDWAEKEMSPAWADLPIESLSPVSESRPRRFLAHPRDTF